MHTRAQVAIVGGGISGLAAAYEFHRRGIRFVLFERAARAGGVVLTEQIGGYTIDAGPDALLTQKPAAIALCRELGLGGRLAPQRRRETFVVRGGRLRKLPDASIFGIPTRWTPFVTTSAFSVAGKLRMAAECLIPGRPQDDESIASFMGRRFGHEAVDYLAEPLLAGIHGGDAERLSMRALFPRFLDFEKSHGSVILGLRRAPAPRAGATPFMALPTGMHELTAALIASLPSESIRIGLGVDAIEPSGGGFHLELSSGEHIRTPAVFMATPPGAAGRLLAGVDRGLAGECRRIRSTSVVTVAVGYPRANVRHPLAGTGCVVPRRERMSVRALSWVSSKWMDRAPDDRVLLRAYVGGGLDPTAIDRDDATIVDGVLSECARLLGIHGTPDLTRVYRWRDATPQQELGHRAIVRGIEDRLLAHPGLVISAAGFRGSGIADCVADARAQAAAYAELAVTS
jgi:oxygen-dependent protoporphyrinogen oxidase